MRRELAFVLSALFVLGLVGCAAAGQGEQSGEPTLSVTPDQGADAEPTRGEPVEPELLEVRRIWDEAPHNAFTDLVRFRDRWYCVFREGKAHVSPDGSLRVIVSEDGETWESAALISSDLGDLRDAKIVVTPDDRLMLSGAVALRAASVTKHWSLVWFSEDGTHWSDAVKVGDPGIWLWRVTWHRDTAYGIGYSTGARRFIRLYKSDGGEAFDVLVKDLAVPGYPNETSILFDEDDSALCLLRRDPFRNSSTAQLGHSEPPYTEWTWTDLGVRIGGPHMIRLPDGRIVAAMRLYDGSTRTSLSWLDPEAGTLEEFLTLPSGGDTSYPGLVYHEGVLWVSYYSSHEGKTAIYLAKVRL